MANIDRLARAENELKSAEKSFEAAQSRMKAVQQRVLKLRAERILELVKNAGMGPGEVQELISVYQSRQRLERSSRETDGSADAYSGEDVADPGRADGSISDPEQTGGSTADPGMADDSAWNPEGSDYGSGGTYR